MKKIGLLVLGACLVLSACSDTKKVAPREGRIAIINNSDIQKSNEKVRLEKSVAINEWLMSNANEQNKLPAITFSKDSYDWKQKGASKKKKLPLSSPVIIKEKIYVLDSESNLIAHDVRNGEKLWQVDSKTKAQGIGLVTNKNLIIIADEKGTVIAYDNEGKVVWEKELKTTLRTSPLLANNVLYLLSSSNDLWALEAKNGNEKWHYKTIAPLTLLQGMGRPALAGNVLIVPFSNGEVVAFDAKTGALLWSQDLVGLKSFDAIAALAQMSASPVIDNGIVYLIGHGGQTLAVNVKTGESLWDITRGGKTTPIVNGNALFFVDNQNNLLAINKKNGKLFWETSLGKSLWKGPYLVDGKLVLFSNNQTALASPEDGKISLQEGGIEGSDPIFTNDGLFFLGNNGTLYHWGKI